MDIMKDYAGMIGYSPNGDTAADFTQMGMPKMGMPYAENPFMQNPMMHLEYMYMYYKYMCKYLEYLEKCKEYQKKHE